MNEINLNFLRDNQGNYILKHSLNGELEYLQQKKNFIVHSGEYKNNFIISITFFNRKLQHKLEDVVKDIEKSVLLNLKIYKEDILSERIIAEIKPEKEFNPLFATMTNKEIEEYTKNSIKVRVVIHYEFHIKIKSHLALKGLSNSFKKFFKEI